MHAHMQSYLQAPSLASKGGAISFPLSSQGIFLFETPFKSKVNFPTFSHQERRFLDWFWGGLHPYLHFIECGELIVFYSTKSVFCLWLKVQKYKTLILFTFFITKMAE